MLTFALLHLEAEIYTLFLQKLHRSKKFQCLIKRSPSPQLKLMAQVEFLSGHMGKVLTRNTKRLGKLSQMNIFIHLRVIFKATWVFCKQLYITIANFFYPMDGASNVSKYVYFFVYVWMFIFEVFTSLNSSTTYE